MMGSCNQQSQKQSNWRTSLAFKALLVPISIGLPGCLSFFDSESAEEPQTASPKALALPQEEQLASQRDVARLQSRVDSHAQSLASLRSEIERLKQGLRSGLLDPVPAQMTQEAEGTASQEGHSEAKLDLPELGFEDLDQPDPDLLRVEFGRLEKDDRPYSLLEQAIMSFEKKDHAAVIVTLTNLSTKYPGYRDEGLSDVLLAESWNALGSPDRALEPLERFMGLHSSSRLLPRAKLAQAEALFELGEREKATQLLLQVVAIAPSEKTADLARAKLMELKDVR